MLLKQSRMAASLMSTTMLLFIAPLLQAKTSKMALGDA